VPIEKVPRGELSPKAALNEDVVRAIRRRLAATGESAREIAALFGLKPGCVRDVITGRTWKHLPLREDERLGFPPRVGADHRQSVLSSAQRAEIVQRFMRGGVTQVDLGRELGVSRSVIGRVLLTCGIAIGRGCRNGKPWQGHEARRARRKRL
jgi:predicted transcriptional regulator